MENKNSIKKMVRKLKRINIEHDNSMQILMFPQGSVDLTSHQSQSRISFFAHKIDVNKFAVSIVGLTESGNKIDMTFFMNEKPRIEMFFESENIKSLKTIETGENSPVDSSANGVF